MSAPGQLDLFDDKPKELTVPDGHFVFSITYECVNKWHDKCKGSKCYCPCHYRTNKRGHLVKKTKAEIAEEEAAAKEAADIAWNRLVSNPLPGEFDGEDMKDIPKTETGLPQGFKCTICSKYHEYDQYVFDHWTDRLAHSCDNCGAKHALQSGTIKRTRDARRGWLPF